MRADILHFLKEGPWALELYEAVEGHIFAVAPGAEIIVQKTQIVFKDQYQFAFLWLPLRRARRQAERYIVLTLGLARPIGRPLLIAKGAPTVTRWPYHTIIEKPEHVDNDLLALIREAHSLALADKRKWTP